MRVRGLKHVTWVESPGEMEVAPRAGAWIETATADSTLVTAESHPVRVRGLKPFADTKIGFSTRVAPRAGAWIETLSRSYIPCKPFVAPRAGAWIETFPLSLSVLLLKSHPVRVRGLKLFLQFT